MKTRLFFSSLALLLIASTFTFAATSDFGPTDKLRKEIALRLHCPDLEAQDIYFEAVAIQFGVEETGALKLMAISTDNQFLKDFITERLKDYRVHTEGVKPDQVFTMTVTFQREL